MPHGALNRWPGNSRTLTLHGERCLFGGRVIALSKVMDLSAF